MGVPTMDQQWLNTYREEIGGFSNTIHSFAQGEIARKDYKGISGGFGSYAQRDAAKHMLRLRLPGGRVTPERLHFMAPTWNSGTPSVRSAEPHQQSETARRNARQ